MTIVADDIFQALDRRHPAFEGNGARWTCLKEWRNIDYLALESWADARVIGYEVKVSRSDMRSELLKPSKRTLAVASTTQFFFAVPHGMLKEKELAYVEPEWEPGDFMRTICPSDCNKQLMRKSWYSGKNDRSHHRGMARVPVPYAGPDYPMDRRGSGHNYRYNELLWTYDKCPSCGGSSYLSKSRVEIEAPTLWVPSDVGLVEVYESGATRIVRKAPIRKMPAPISGPMAQYASDEEWQARVERQYVNQIVRWTSQRPDHRHASQS